MALSYDIRCINIESTDAIARTPDPGNFVCTLGNTLVEIHSRLVGVSLNTCIFPNLIPNVRSKYTTLKVEVADTVSGEGTYQLTIRGGQLTIEGLVAQLNTASEDMLGAGKLVWSTSEPYPGSPLVLLATVDETWVAGGTVTFVVEDGVTNLGRIIGLLATTTLTGSFPVATFVPNLGGEQVAYLRSRELCQSRQSVNGKGRSQDVLAVIPINAGYGYSVVYKNDRTERPTIVFPQQSPTYITNVDLRLCDHDGDILELQAGNLVVSVHVWTRAL